MHDEVKSFLISAEYKSVTARMINRDGKPFWVRMTSEGLEFISGMSGSGIPEGNPIEVAAAEVFGWVGEKEGESGTKFKDRAAFKRG